MSSPSPRETFDLWATSDAHVVREALAEGVDPARVPRASMEEAIRQVEGEQGFHYDIGFHLGDILDYDHETAENFQAFRNQLAFSRKDVHDWYHLGGNNDENSVLNDQVSIDNEYYRKVIDPVGEFTADSGIDNSRRRFPVCGTYERYSFDVGNIRFVFLSDRNDLPAPYGRGEGGFYVDGAITLESYQWLARQVITWPDRILVVACHHALKNTTLGTQMDDSWKGQYMTHYNPGHHERPTQRLQSVLHQVHPIHEFDSPLFARLLEQNDGVVDMWLAGHIHHRVDETFEGRGKYARAYGGHHLNVGNLCRFRHMANIISAQSTLFSWQVGCAKVLSQVYVHDHPQLPVGFYEPERRLLQVKQPFAWEAARRQVHAPTAGVSELQLTKAGAGRAKLSWQSSATGTLIVRSHQPRMAFEPQDGEVYDTSQRWGDDEVIFLGSSREVFVSTAASSSPVYFHVLPYNAGSGAIRYASGQCVTMSLPPFQATAKP